MKKNCFFPVWMLGFSFAFVCLLGGSSFVWAQNESGGAVLAEDDTYEDGAYDEQDTASAEEQVPQSDVDEAYFFDKLSPYGDWTWTPEYGWVWKPRGIWPGWRPYTYGYWTNTTEGWTWTSSFVWGWAPFHYGNWVVMDGLGWVWVPGTVWAPAWVMWRYSDDYIGWAPLLPGFNFWYGWSYYPVYYSHWTFLGWDHLGDRNPHHHYMPRKGTRAAFRHTHSPRNCRSRADAACGRGPLANVVRKHTKLPVEVHKLDNVAQSRRLPKPDRVQLGLRNDSLKIFRPRTKRLPGADRTMTGQGRPLPSKRRTVDLGIVSDTNHRVIDMEALRERESEKRHGRPAYGATIAPKRPGRSPSFSSPSTHRHAPTSRIGVRPGKPSFSAPKSHSSSRPSFRAPKSSGSSNRSLRPSRSSSSKSSSSSNRSFRPSRSSSSKSSSSSNSSKSSSGRSSSRSRRR